MDDDENIVKILIATDNHIGYMEKDPVRCNDSIESFEEILRTAREKEVDFILLGGDLFHENKPSRQVLHKTMELLRHYCMGAHPCPVEVRSDQAVNFQHSKFPVVNYEDPNYNIAIPIFSIHGNHDDPSGEGSLSVMDILSVANLVNYFGKTPDIERVEVSPLLLQKGTTRLAIYGLGSCRDERLHRMFRGGKVKFLRPSEEEGEWFSVLILHQNRAKHGATNFIPVSFIPEFFDLVFWAHEHECLIEPEFVCTGYEEGGEERGVYITQPGSSVATSLTDGEVAKKHIGILQIKGCTFKIDPIPLQTVRPFIIDSVTLSRTKIPPEEEEQVAVYLTEKVKSLIDRAASESESSKLPLIRLKVDYTGGYSTFSLARFGQKFVNEVANPRNILLWHRQREQTSLSKKVEEVRDHISSADLRILDSSNVASLLVEQLKDEKLSILSEKNLAEALTEFVDKEEREAISDFVKYSLQQTQDFLRQRPINEAELDSQIAQQREELCKRQEAAADEARAHLREVRASMPEPSDEFDHRDSDSDNSSSRPEERGERGRGRGGRRGRGSRGGGARGGGRGRGKGTKSKTSATGASGSSHTLLSFSAGGSATVTTTKSKTTASKGRSSKKAITYEDDSESDDVVEVMDFTASSSSRKRASRTSKSSASSSSKLVDLTQSDNSDDDNPFSSFAPPHSKRKKH